jgi:DsbC/DsbD-like thiol-disulfide interchange protein
MKSLNISLAVIFWATLALGLHAQDKAESEAAIMKFSLKDADQLKKGEKATFVIEVTPKNGWHTYSAMPSEDGAYLPAALGWDVTSRGFEAAEKLDEQGAMFTEFDDIMNGMMRYYKAPMTFSQEVKLTETDLVFAGYVDYMACNDEKCIPLTAEFKFEAQVKE